MGLRGDDGVVCVGDRLDNGEAEPDILRAFGRWGAGRSKGWKTPTKPLANRSTPERGGQQLLAFVPRVSDPRRMPVIPVGTGYMG